MRTTLNLDPDLLKEVLEDTGERDRGRALNRIMAEHLRRRRIERLLSLRGKLDLRENWSEWEDAELKKMKRADDHRGR